MHLPNLGLELDGDQNKGKNGTTPKCKENTTEHKNKGHILMLYVQGVCECIKTFAKSMVHKPTLKW